MTFQITGFVNGDDAGDLTTQPTCSTVADESSSVAGSPYAITCSGAADETYAFNYVAGQLTITPASLTITADDQSKVYGSADPVFTASYAGLQGADTAPATPPTCDVAGPHASVAGSPYVITCSGAVDSNYSISYVAGSLTVTTATLTVSANDKTKTYGAANPTLTHTTTGFVNGDDEGDLTGTITCSTTANEASAVGTYPITCAWCDEHQLHDQLRGRHPDGDAGDADGDRGQPDQGVWRGEPDADAHDDRVRER